MTPTQTTEHNWHVSVHRRPPGSLNERPLSWRGWNFRETIIPANQFNVSFDASFDSLVDAINQLDNGYAEGDGSLGLVGPGGHWKLVGTIYEVQNQIQHIELMGYCPCDALELLITQLQVDKEDCLFQMMQGGFFVTFHEFGRWNRFF